MKKVLFGIFAHPDDEAFGPAASLYKAAQNGTDIHLVLVTDGESGTNTDNVTDLGSVRLKEWEQSRQQIGAVSGLALHYPDGGLCNDMYLEIAAKIQSFITTTLQGYNEPIEVDFMTFDTNGISGHLDHIAVSYITTFCYLQFRANHLPSITLGTLKYYCLPRAILPATSTNWLYMQAGRPQEMIDETVDFKDCIKQKLAIMKIHHSQRKDMDFILSEEMNRNSDASLIDHFYYFKN